MVDEATVAKPNEATEHDLLLVHTKRYLKSLKWSLNVARIAEVPPLIFVPNYVVRSNYLLPMKYQTGGSILAGKLALERGWSINIGGGFHHCRSDAGSGFCPYADITLLIQFLFNNYPQKIKNVMVVDLDAHQGNGYERDFISNQNVAIMDVYNRGIYPCGRKAKKSIRWKVELDSFTKDADYIAKVEETLQQAFREFHPDILVYNAGTDILKGDCLGRLSITAKGIIQRDELVFKKAQLTNTPIVMLTSGGYLKKTAKIIATSILNLHDVGLIKGPVSHL